MYSRNLTTVGLAMALAAAMCACHRSPPKTPAIGEAFVGPGTLKIRSDIPLNSAVVATVKHGDRVEILTRRRRFMRVRTPNGTEGWTDERQLLAAEDMTYLRDLAARAAKMPVQGQGTTYSDLNVRTQPSSSAPSFFQIKEKEKVDVLLHIVTPRVDVPRTPLLPPPVKKPKAATKKSEAREPKVPPPPMPKPPGLPPNWEELSKTPRSDDDAPPDEEVVEKPPVPQDEWSLVRNREGQSGWILTRRLVMAIPDEVAQYAEGKRIVSYFPIGQIHDGDLTKSVWLWTTTSNGKAPYDFESFRVFIWSLRHHRYETAHIERNIHGYAPVLVRDFDYEGSGKAGGESASGKYPGFSICMDNKDGQRVRREFVLLTNVIRYAGEQACEPPAPFDAMKPRAPLKTAPEPELATEKPGFFQRTKQRIKGWFGKK